MLSTSRAIVGRPAPDFLMPSTRDIQTLDEPVRLSDYRDRWLVMVFYPQDFTFVCPTELRGFNERLAEFNEEGADVLGVSTDSVYTHRAWMKTPRDKGGLGELRYPLASDPTHEVSRDYGVLVPGKGHTLRATFLIDPDGVLRYSVISDVNVGRSVGETLRTLQAFKAGGLCPVDWQRSEPMLEAA
jgi:peroxiredoxin 2/4